MVGMVSIGPSISHVGNLAFAVTGASIRWIELGATPKSITSS